MFSTIVVGTSSRGCTDSFPEETNSAVYASTSEQSLIGI